MKAQQFFLALYVFGPIAIIISLVWTRTIWAPEQLGLAGFLVMGAGLIGYAFTNTAEDASKELVLLGIYVAVVLVLNFVITPLFYKRQRRPRGRPVKGMWND